MMMWVVCLLFTLRGLLAVSEKPMFGLFAPPDIYYPSEEQICIHTSGDLKGFSHLSVNLETSTGKRCLYTVPPNQPVWHCQSFQVPEPTNNTETVHIEVEGMEIGGDKVQLGTKALTLRKKSRKTFIQTDRPVYKPGQEVKFRVMTINQDLEVQYDNHSLIDLQDPQGNRLAQWKDVVPSSGIAERSYQLSPEPMLGKYRINVGGAKLEFEVREYVLPKFEMIIDAPQSISIVDDVLPIQFLGRYTYGQPVHGNVSLKVCQTKRPRYSWARLRSEEGDLLKDVCHNEVSRIDQSGKSQHVLDLGKFNIRSSDYNRELKVEATLEEEGTGVKSNAVRSINLESQLTKLSFKDTRSYFQPGAPYRGKLVLTAHDGQPLSSKKIYLAVSHKDDVTKETFVTDTNGEAEFQVSTEKWGKDSVSLSATTGEKDESYVSGKIQARYGRANLYLKDIYAQTRSSLYIHPVKTSSACHQNVAAKVDYDLEEEGDGQLVLNYLVVLNGKIVHQGQKTVEGIKADALSGSVELSLPIRDISPSGKLLVFTVSKSGSVAADTTTVQVTPCLKHAVSMKFSEPEVLPGSNVKMLLQANGGSTCALRAVDKSVLMMKPEDELTESKFQNMVKPERTHIWADSLDYKYCEGKKTREVNGLDFSNSDPWFDPWWVRSYPEKKKDFQNVIQEMTIYLVSSWNIVAPTTCKTERMAGYFGSSEEMELEPEPPRRLFRRPMKSAAHLQVSELPDEAMEGSEESNPSEQEVRSYFPETWIWDMQPIPPSGSAEIMVPVPDAITEWSSQMICVGPRSLGMTSTNLRVFQPFFVELELPYSVKRGETLQLKASVFNYMNKNMMIRTSLPASDQFLVNSPESMKFCLSGGQKKTVSWKVTPTMLGQMNVTVISEAVKNHAICDGQKTVVPEKGARDAMVKSLRVEPEGIPVEKSHNSMLMVEGNSVTETVSLDLPEFWVEGSEKAFLGITGDIMGTAMNNVDSLLAMSYGCGEQNMVKFAPNVYILQYLKASGQLSTDTLEKGKKFLDGGLQRQLTYKHNDGSYSAFGKSDKEGSSWLTAFVTKCFCMAEEFTFIDKNHMKLGMAFLEKQQKDDGCFQAKGRLLNNGLKGGVDDEISLTAYILIGLLECGRNDSDPVVEKGFQCLKSQPLEGASPYKLALQAYAYSLANHAEDLSQVRNHLNPKATKGDGVLYWTQEAKVDKDSYWAKPKSVDVEITAYVLLSLVSISQPTSRDVGDMMPMVRWLTKQQNANGGFSSTQDTVVGLQALSKFASIASAKSGDVVIDVTSLNGFSHRLIVNNDNRLLLQKVALPKLPGEYLVTASGAGTVFMQVSQRYHSPPVAKESAFSLSVYPQCVTRDLLQLQIEYWYTGDRNNTNMALMEIKMLSGCTPKKESLAELKLSSDVKRVEFKDDDDVVYVYMDKVTSEHETLMILADCLVKVTDMKPSTVKIFDYYMPEEEKTVCYLSECQ
ncbi:alpha-2-macroglobulin-like protein 1 isoform X2 [Hyperolius riggenbachi]|uniref:alpha-2-macroglobulin-like protein 1 isoform X2 n=1 Tax=Hyperolius riggenbachi TaxID=752182 RepID=UPI0035A36CB2